MPSPVNLPKTFATDDPKKLKTELERLSQELDKYVRGLSDTVQFVPAVVGPNPTSLAFGQIAQVNVTDGSTLVMKLPRPDPTKVGKRCGVRRASTTGEVLIYAVGCLVGGAERYRMANDIHYVEFLYDGDYYPSKPGGGS
jgi:hypothetical protein